MSCVGLVPGRPGTQLTLSSALRIEHSIMIGGNNLDITKYFNAVGRLPAKILNTKDGYQRWFTN